MQQSNNYESEDLNFDNINEVEVPLIEETEKPKRKPREIKNKREKATSTKGHYINNAELLETVIADKKTGVLSDKLARYLMLLTERYSLTPKFARYSFREDMVSAAMVNLVNNWHKFNADLYDNPFSFYTTAIHRSFLNYLLKEKDERDIRDKLLLSIGANPSFSFQERDGDDYLD